MTNEFNYLAMLAKRDARIAQLETELSDMNGQRDYVIGVIVRMSDAEFAALVAQDNAGRAAADDEAAYSRGLG